MAPRMLDRDQLDALGKTPREVYVARVIRQGFKELDPTASEGVIQRVVAAAQAASREEAKEALGSNENGGK